MKDVTLEPIRLKDQHGQRDVTERLASQAARDSAAPEPLSAIAMARISAHIDARRGKHRLPPFGWVLVVGAFLLGIVTAASAAHLDLLPDWLTRLVPSSAKHSPSPAPPAPPSTRRPRSRPEGPARPAPTTVGETEVPTTVASAVEPAPRFVPDPQPPSDRQTKPGRQAASARPSQPRPTEGARRMAMLVDEPAAPRVSVTPRPAAVEPAAVGAAVQVPAPSPSPLSDARTPSASPPSGATATAPALSASPSGSAPALPPAKVPTAASAAAPTAAPSAGLLKEIVRALRVEHAPKRALALLDQHSTELAGQAFAEESLLLRVEAMLALGERASVLRLLDRTSLSDLAVASTLLITRGELRASAHRCAEGIGDFDLVLAASRRPPKSALLGRARCKQQLGDLAGAQADFARYRREFPGDPQP